MPCDNYNFFDEPSGAFIDINRDSCFNYTNSPEVPDKKLNEVVTFKGQFYYRAPLEVPIMSCCCGGPDNPCPPEPQPQPCPPPEPEPCPDPEPCPEPDDDCFTGVTCNGNTYETIDDAIYNETCIETIFVGCGSYLFPCSVVDGMCLQGMGADKTCLITTVGQSIGGADISIMDASIKSLEADNSENGAGLVVESERITFKNVVFKYADMRSVDLWLTSGASKVVIVNCDFSKSAGCAISAVNKFRGALRITSSKFDNQFAIDLMNTRNCQIMAVTSEFAGQVSYACEAEFNGCVFRVGDWKKVNISPKGNTEFVSCQFDNTTDTGWKDESRDNQPVIGMKVGCGRESNIYKFNNCIFDNENGVDKSVIFLSRTRDYAPNMVFFNGEEQIIDDNNWGLF